MALEFGGLGSALFAGMREFERQEDRETIQKDRELAKKEREEDRAYQRQQREYQAAQQKRTLAEQTREDQFRDGIAGVRTADQVSESAVGTVYGQDAPVMRDDDGNLMPGAVETKPAQTTSRQRNKDDIMAEYAEIARKAGKLDQALKFDEQAAAESMKRGKALFSQWSASTPDDGNLEQAIKQATQIYNGDRLPGQVQGYKMNPDGSATVDIKNTATGQAVPVTFKNVAELKQGLEGYYSPETLDAYRKSLREARIKAQEKIAEERAKPVTTPAGAVTTFGAGDPRGTVSNDTGYVWTGRLNADGSREMVKPGKYSRAGGADGGGDGDGDGTGGGKKKGKTPLDVATSSVMDAIKESAESKTLNADQLIGVQATARELVANAIRNEKELDPYVAGKVALTAVLKPESVKIGYNPATGTFENTVRYNGNEFSVGRVDQATMPESQLKGVAQTFVSKLPADSRADYIRAAAGDKAAIDKFNADVTAAHGKQWADRFTAVYKRRPTQQDVQDSIARTQAVVSQNIQLVAASGAVEQDKKQRETASRNQAAAAAKAAIGTPAQIMALPPGKAEEIYRQYGAQTDGFQREALQRKMQQDRTNMSVGGMRQQ
jgi:hypothetical protein